MTKKWNCLENFSISFAGLPQKEERKIENIHFLATSNVVPSAPLGKSIAEDLKGTYLLIILNICKYRRDISNKD